MKKIIPLLILILLLSITSCNNHQITDQEKKQIIISNLQEDIPQSTNLTILTSKKFRDKEVILFAYDQIDVGRFVGYRFVKINGNKIEVMGGGGGNKVNPDIPLSLFSGGSISSTNEKPYLITFGETNNEKITKIKVTYNDNTSLIEPVDNNGVLILHDGYVRGINKFEALDKEAKVLYHFP